GRAFVAGVGVSCLPLGGLDLDDCQPSLINLLRPTIFNPTPFSFRFRTTTLSFRHSPALRPLNQHHSSIATHLVAARRLLALGQLRLPQQADLHRTLSPPPR